MDEHVRVRFLEGRRGQLRVLELDVPAGWARFERLKKALYALNLRVISSSTQPIGNRLVHWMRIVDRYGSTIHESRRGELESRVVSLLEDRKHTHRRNRGDVASSPRASYR